MTTMNLKPTDDDPAVDNPSVEWNDDMVLQWANAVIYKSWSSPLGRHIFVELEKMGYTEHQSFEFVEGPVDAYVFTMKSRINEPGFRSALLTIAKIWLYKNLDSQLKLEGG